MEPPHIRQGSEEMSTRDLTEFAQITPEELNDRLARGEECLVLDVLPGEVFEKRHIPGAKNACVYEVVFRARVEDMGANRGEALVVYGADGEALDAPTAAEKLARLGYLQVHILKGGFAAWRDKGFAVEGTAPGVELEDEDGRPYLPPPGTYGVDVERSVVEWAGRNANAKHHGTLRLATGEITVRDGRVAGTFEIDMDSIRNVNLEGDEWQPVLIAHLKSDDFFFVDRFPKAVFTIESTSSIADATSCSPNIEVEGTLELRGVRGGLRFPVIVNRLEDGAFTAEAHFDFDRTRWGIVYGSPRFFRHLGMHRVFEHISIQVRIVTKPR